MPLQSRKSMATLMGVMCSTSQCELRSTFPNLRVMNVIRIVTYYTLPPLESPDSSWMTRSQRSRRRDKGLSLSLCVSSSSSAVHITWVHYGFQLGLCLGWYGHLMPASVFHTPAATADRVATAAKPVAASRLWCAVPVKQRK